MDQNIKTSISEIFDDSDFQKILNAKIKFVQESLIFVNKSKTSGFRTLHNKGLLNVKGIKAHFKDILLKKSKLSSGERDAMLILVQDSLIENNELYLKNLQEQQQKQLI